MDSVKRIAGIIALCILTMAANAEDGSSDVMRSNGKIYVVVAVVVTIVVGLFLYLLNLDRKISKVEKRRD
jgi:multisubunit Na+/H+ antiporter MnhB subunit